MTQTILNISHGYVESVARVFECMSPATKTEVGGCVGR